MQNIGPVSALGGAIISDVPTAEGQMAVSRSSQKRYYMGGAACYKTGGGHVLSRDLCVRVRDSSPMALVGLGH